MESKQKEISGQDQQQDRQSAIPAAIRGPFVALKNFIVASYQIICDASWVFFTSLAVVYGPVMFETERQRSKQPCEPLAEAADRVETDKNPSP